MSSENKLTLGQFLRQEREKRGMTIEQVASATKINVRILHALEEDQYRELPAKPFIRGFVTSYVRFIGIDAREVLTQFDQYIETRVHDRPSREGGHSGYAFEKREGEQGSRAILGATMGAFVVGGIAFLIMKPSLLKHRNSHIDKLKNTHHTSAHDPKAGESKLTNATILENKAAEPLTAATPTPKTSPIAPSTTEAMPSSTPLPLPSATPSSAPSAAPVEETKKPVEDPLNSGIGLAPAEIKHKVTFRALKSVWVRYQVDDRKVMEFPLRQGKVLVLRGQKLIKFQTSDPGSMNYNYNNTGNHAVTDNKSLTTRQNNATLIFPPEQTSSIQDVFPGEKSINQRPVPQPLPSHSPSPAPAN
jgi:cytoskeletal protein RodZ